MNTREYWSSRWQGWKSPVNRFARRSFSQFHGRGYKTLLDAGCGPGSDALYFARKGLDVTAVDMSESGLAELEKSIRDRKAGSIRVLSGDITALDFPASSFDVVYSHLSLHYFDDAVTTAALNGFYEMLRPGGMLCVKCKSTDDELYGQGEKVGEDMYLNGHVRHFFSRDYMAEKLSRFRIIRLGKTASLYHGYKSHFIEAAAVKL